MKQLPLLLVIPLTATTATAIAIEPLGFRFGMSPDAVLESVKQRGMGETRWFGRTLRVQGANEQDYMFNFCQEQLYEIAATYRLNFDAMANIVDSSIKTYGQPWYVSADGAMTDNGFLRPINLYWKIDDKSFMRLMEMPHSYALVYQTKNSCVKVPT